MNWTYSKMDSHRNARGITRVEIVGVIIMLSCLISIMAPLFVQKKRSSEVILATINVQTLYQNQVLMYFSTRSFAYSLTRTASWPDFFSARPPKGQPEKLIGYKQNNQTRRKGDIDFVDWDKVGFPLVQPSYFIYRAEPEPKYAKLAKPRQDNGNPYHFHAAAIGDVDGDDKYSILLRGGYVNEQGFFHGMKKTYVADYME